MIYAQAEDDFNRVETNYLNALGPRSPRPRAKARSGSDLRETAVHRPGRPEGALCAKARAWLKTLMNAWADGLNYYLATHPKVKPRVITHFEPWMALSFTEGSIGGDIERVSLSELEAFYGQRASWRMPPDEHGLASASPAARTASPSRRPTPPTAMRCC